MIIVLYPNRGKAIKKEKKKREIYNVILIISCISTKIGISSKITLAYVLQ